MPKRNAQGSGTIRKKTVIRNGKEYTFWEARYSVGTDTGSGKQIQRSISGKTQKEVRQKLTEVTAEIDAGTYREPCKMTVDEWLDMHGINMGRSRFSKVKPGYELQEGERWAKQPGVGDCDTQQEFTAVPEEKTNKDYIEIVEEPGLCNDYIARDVINAMYFKELESKFPKYPWAWQRPRLRGFGF